MDDDVEVDRFRVQLTASEHGPMTIDDLCGLDAFCLDVGENLPHRVGRRTFGGEHHPTAWALWIIELSGCPSSWAIELVIADIVRRRLASAASARLFRLSSSARRRARR